MVSGSVRLVILWLACLFACVYITVRLVYTVMIELCKVPILWPVILRLSTNYCGVVVVADGFMSIWSDTSCPVTPCCKLYVYYGLLYYRLRKEVNISVSRPVGFDMIFVMISNVFGVYYCFNGVHCSACRFYFYVLCLIVSYILYCQLG
jgi:hypothetical protein